MLTKKCLAEILTDTFVERSNILDIVSQPPLLVRLSLLCINMQPFP